MTRLLITALAYAKMGWAVFPLRPRDKIPATGHGVNDASTDPETIKRWWTAQPDANIGIACGPASGLMVLDVDVPNPARDKFADGEVQLGLLIEKHGGLPVTPTLQTGVYDGRRGRQFAFRCFDGATNTVGKLAPGLDTRAAGGYIVGPPSVHPSGAVYEWLIRPSQQPLAEAPSWLQAWFRDRKAPPAPTGPIERPDWSKLDRYVQRALESEFTRIAMTGAGGRNQAINEGAFNLGTLVGAGAMSRSEAEAALRAAAQANGWAQEAGPRQLEAVIKSGLDAGERKPREIPADNVVSMRQPPARKPGPIASQALAIATAPAPAYEPDPQAWREELLVNAEGGLKKQSFHNAILILMNMPETAGLFVHNDFRGLITVTRRPPWALNGFEPGPLTDPDIAGCRLWLERQQCSVTKADAYGAIEYIAAQSHTNPVRDYLEGVVWDGKPRLDHWLSDYLGATETPFVQAAGAKWLIGAVARVMQPGAKVDTMLILEGPQGLKKSSALACLATLGGERYFTDEIAALGTKDAAQQLLGNLIVEMAELDALGRSDVKAIKAFLTRQVDKVRLPYARTVSTLPRQCVFAGTVNPDGTGYLRDPTGGRRFWPVTCTAIDLAALERDREQLWAEAVARWRDGESWWLTDEAVIEEARQAQDERRETDPLLGMLDAYLGPKTRVTTLQVLNDCWGFAHRDCDKRAEMRAAACLKALGWVRDRRRIDGEVTRVWVREGEAGLL